MGAAHRIRVLVVVKDPVVSVGLRTILNQAEGIVCAPSREGDTAAVRGAVAREAPDVLLLDVALRRSDPQLIADVVERHPGTRVLVYVDHSPQRCALQQLLELGGRARLSPGAQARLDDCCLTSLRQRAHGCLGTGLGVHGIVEAVRAVAAGEVAAAPWLASLAETVRLAGGGDASPISVRELEVMTLLARGLSNKRIARQLGIRERTVKNHVTRAMEKLGPHNRTEVGLLAARHGLRLMEEDGARWRRPAGVRGLNLPRVPPEPTSPTLPRGGSGRPTAPGIG